MMTPSGNAQVGTGGARFAGPTPAINVSLGGFLLLFVASHILYLVLVHPGSLLNSPSEELYRGTIAQELVTGLKLPFTEYRANNESGGALVIGALAAGFFLLFGPTVFALKLAPLLMFTLALVFWYWTIQRYASERVARYVAVLFCFSPPLFTTYTVTAMGFHSESIFFSALTVFLLFRMLSDDREGSLAFPALLGLTAGFGLWFGYIYGLTLLAMLGFWLWHDKGKLWRPRVLWFALGFVVGFAPWILINVQNHFAGLVIRRIYVWEHFGLPHLWDGLAHPRKLSPVEFLRTIGSDDSWDLYRRAVNLLYSLLLLGPILTVGVLRLKTGRSAPAGMSPTRPTLVGFSILYLLAFALAVQLSDFRDPRYFLPAYPFLFFFVAHSLARCQDLLPHVQRPIQTVFLTSVVVLGLGTHAPLLSLDRSGVALSTKGYSYAVMPDLYLYNHAPGGAGVQDSIPQMVESPFLSSILPKLSADDQRELSRWLAMLLGAGAPLNGEAREFSRIEGLVPPGFEKHFYYRLGVMAMERHLNELPKAVAAVEFVRHRSAAAHHLALIGIYRAWPWFAFMDSSPESLAHSPAPVAPELSPHYWRALGLLAGRYWYEKDPSLSRLNAHLKVFVPRLDPTMHKYFLQGVGELLFTHRSNSPWVLPAELDRLPQAYQEGLLEGWGMALGESDLFSGIPGKGQESLSWMAATKGFSARSLVSIQQGKVQFDALFEGPAPSVSEPPLRP